MKKLVGAALLGQSGGPTSVINASAAGVFLEALKHKGVITHVYGAIHGIRGVLNEQFYDMGQEDPKELLRLKNTPSSAIGSVRFKLENPAVDDSQYHTLLAVFKKYNIRYFFYNGGNDSMDTCHKISEFMKNSGWDCRVIGVPKTIDNDLYGTDHSPGFASAAKYVATTLMELSLDAQVYDTKSVVIVEVMGRNAGWLTGAAELAKLKGANIDLIYLPEKVFNIDKFYQQIETLLETQNSVIAVISEGIKTADGKHIPEIYQDLKTDSFGHAQLGGAAHVLADQVGSRFGVKVRPIEFSLIQRSAAHLASAVDVDEAFQAGSRAVEAAVNGETDKMVGFKRISSFPYKMEYVLTPLEIAANTEQKVPLTWIKEDGQGLTKEYVEYALPLIQGDDKASLEDGLPRFAKLKKVVVSMK